VVEWQTVIVVDQASIHTLQCHFREN